MGTSTGQNNDVKDIVMAGCLVHLAFLPAPEDRWRVEGTVRCGIEENHAEQSFSTDSQDSREAAEAEALRRVTGLLGSNVDRNTSRVENWS